MFSANSEICVLLNVINSHPHPNVPITPRMYEQHFRKLMPTRRIRNKDGDISVVMVDKREALSLLKDQYGFMSQSDVEKELNDARSDL